MKTAASIQLHRAAARFKVNTGILTRLVEQHKIRARRIGGTYMITDPNLAAKIAPFQKSRAAFTNPPKIAPPKTKLRQPKVAKPPARMAQQVQPEPAPPPPPVAAVSEPVLSVPTRPIMNRFVDVMVALVAFAEEALPPGDLRRIRKWTDDGMDLVATLGTEVMPTESPVTSPPEPEPDKPSVIAATATTPGATRRGPVEMTPFKNLVHLPEVTQVVSLKEASRMTGCSYISLYCAIREGRLKGHELRRGDHNQQHGVVLAEAFEYARARRKWTTTNGNGYH